MVPENLNGLMVRGVAGQTKEVPWKNWVALTSGAAGDRANAPRVWLETKQLYPRCQHPAGS